MESRKDGIPENSMDVREFLELGTSRENARILIDLIEGDPVVFETLWQIMLEDSYPLSMRASWVICHFARKHPCHLEPRLPELVGLLPGIRSESVRRNLLNILSMLPIPEDHSGYLFDLCYGLLERPGTAIAVRAYAMNILYNISNTVPELKPELITLFESQQDSASAGILSRSKILLKKLYREIS
jgi:hypothetical protein